MDFGIVLQTTPSALRVVGFTMYGRCRNEFRG